MTKRVAKDQMTHDNWMEEEEEEEPGYFSQAPNDKLQNRSIRKAKRRLPEGKNGVPSSPFAKFSGFVGVKTTSASPFNFLANKPTANGNGVEKSSTDIHAPATTTAVKPNPLFDAKPLISQPAPSQCSTTPSKSEGETGDRSAAYLQTLRQLNLSFLSWVQEHMNGNQFCDFSPVCVDYIEHVKNLQKTVVKESVKPLNSVIETPKPAISVQGRTDSQEQKSPARSDPPQSKPSIDFSFFSKRDSLPPPPSVSFSFSSQVASAKGPDSTDAGPDDDNYVPPKNEFEAVVETDAVYSKRCKLFFKKDDKFVENGVGTLYIKQLDGKSQLLVRNDTSLGKILLNISLLKSLPIERKGNNNVMIVCVPDPKVKTEPTPVLFRVKTTQDADELLGKLTQYKT